VISHTPLRILRSLLSDAANGVIPHKFKLFATHDILLIAILKQLGVYTVHPSTASTLFFELHKETKHGSDEPEYYVETIFNGKGLTVRGCRKKCDLKSFLYLLESKTYKY